MNSLLVGASLYVNAYKDYGERRL